MKLTSCSYVVIKYRIIFILLYDCPITEIAHFSSLFFLHVIFVQYDKSRQRLYFIGLHTNRILKNACAIKFHGFHGGYIAGWNNQRTDMIPFTLHVYGFPSMNCPEESGIYLRTRPLRPWKISLSEVTKSYFPFQFFERTCNATCKLPEYFIIIIISDIYERRIC